MKREESDNLRIKYDAKLKELENQYQLIHN